MNERKGHESQRKVPWLQQDIKAQDALKKKVINKLRSKGLLQKAACHAVFYLNHFKSMTFQNMIANRQRSYAHSI